MRTDRRVPRPQHPEPFALSHRAKAVKEGFIDFSAPANAEFVFVGHLISEIWLNGVKYYTFAHDAEGKIDTVTNHQQGHDLDFDYYFDGTIATAAPI